MAEQNLREHEPAPDEHANPNQPEPEASHDGVPRGAMVFAGLMLAVYVVYFAVTWFEVVVLRGSTG